jgi:radical SAM superfamily enzyme YgiQ (UPF0313 family)
MKILFIYPDITSQQRTIHHGLTNLSAVLKQNGHSTALCHLEKFDYNCISTAIKDYRPDITAISTSTNQWEFTKKIAEYIKNMFELPVFVGGAHPTAAPDCIMESKCIDGIGIGECDFAFLELVNKIERNQDYQYVKNFHIRFDKRIIRNELRPLIQDLNILPFPHKELFDIKKLFKYEWGARFMFSRGCPFQCRYCINHVLQKLYQASDGYVRYRSVSKAVEEIKIIDDRYKLKKIFIDDDTFTLNKKWLFQFCSEYKSIFDIPFGCNVRAGTVNFEMLKSLRNAGCEYIHIGIESGDERIRKNILNRFESNAAIIRVFRNARKIGLKTLAFNMIGIPGESPEEFRNTIKLNRKAKPDIPVLSIFYPYPGTELGEMCIKKKLIRRDRLIKDYFEDTILDLPAFPRDKLLWHKARFHWEVYKAYRPMFVLKTIVKTAVRKISYYNLVRNIKKKVQSVFS